MNDLRAFFEDLAGRWDEQQPTDREDVLLDLLAPFAATLGAARAVLEVGTGTGALIPCLERYAPAASTVSIDLAHAMLWRARRRCPEAALVQADVHRLPFAQRGGIFDVVVCHNSFPHFADMPSALRELTRVLTPGGRLLILHDLSREEVNAIHSSGGPAIQHDLLPPGEETRRMMLDADFQDVWVEDLPTHYAASGRRLS